MRKSKQKPSYHLCLILALAGILTNVSCSEEVPSCSGSIERQATAHLEGLWKPDAARLPDTIPAAAVKSVLQSQLSFSDAGYVVRQQNRPPFSATYAAVTSANQEALVHFQTGERCETMRIRRLSEDRIRVHLYEGYPVIEYIRTPGDTAEARP